MLVYTLLGTSRPLSAGRRAFARHRDPRPAPDRELLAVAALYPDALKVVERSPLGQTLGQERMFFNLREAVKAFAKRGKTAWIHSL